VGASVAYALVQLTSAAWAQAASPEDAALEGLRRQEERSRRQQHQLEPKADVLKPATGQRARPGDLPPEERCFTVRELRLQGQDWKRFTWVSDAALPYLGRCLGVQGLARVAGQLDEQLVERGFVTTRVSLPSQNLQSGVLQIQIHVGRISDIRLVDVGPAGPQPGTGWSNAFPVSEGDILNIRDIEQGVEQMKRLPSQSVTTQLEPGRRPDTSILVIQRQAGGLRERLRGGLTLDNSGGAALGRMQLSANLVLDNPLGLNDVVSASISTNAESPSGHHRSQSLGLNYSIPWGYNTLSLSGSHSRFAQFVQGTTVRFLSSGNSQTAEARLQTTLWRSSSARLGVYGGLSLRRAESFLDDVEVLVQRRRTSTAEAGINYKHLLQNGSLELDLGQRRGLSWNAQEDLTTAVAGGPTLRPRMWQATAGYTQGLALGGRQLQYSGNLRAHLRAIDQRQPGVDSRRCRRDGARSARRTGRWRRPDRRGRGADAASQRRTYSGRCAHAIQRRHSGDGHLDCCRRPAGADLGPPDIECHNRPCGAEWRGPHRRTDHRHRGAGHRGQWGRPRRGRPGRSAG
jgi:hemolysin activation/secretion protein